MKTKRKIDVELNPWKSDEDWSFEELMTETLALANVKSVTHVQIDRVANLKQAGRGRKQSNVKSGSVRE